MVASAVTTYSTQHPVPAQPSHCHSRTGLKSAERRTKCYQRAVSSGWWGARGSRERFGGPVEERRAQGSLAAARTAQAWVLDAGGSARPLRSHFQLVRPFPGLPAPPRRLPAPPRPRGCTRSGASVLRAGPAAPGAGRLPRFARPAAPGGAAAGARRPERGGQGGAPRRREPQQEAAERVA